MPDAATTSSALVPAAATPPSAAAPAPTRETFWRATPEQVAAQDQPIPVGRRSGADAEVATLAGASQSSAYVHNQLLGRLGERVAEEHFRGLGAELLERNYRIPYAEIDLLFEHEGELVAVEVKARDVTDLEHPLEAIGHRQLRRIALALTTYAQDNDLLERGMRIDVVAIRVATDGAVEDFEHVRSIYPG